MIPPGRACRCRNLHRSPACSASRRGSHSAASAKASDPKATKAKRRPRRLPSNVPASLNLHGSRSTKALFTIGEQWNINIVAGEVKGTVNGTFKQAPLREILDAILLSNGYNYRAVGKSLVVSSIEQLGQINPFFQSAMIPVQSADIDEVVQGAQLLKTPKGEVRPHQIGEEHRRPRLSGPRENDP